MVDYHFLVQGQYVTNDEGSELPVEHEFVNEKPDIIEQSFLYTTTSKPVTSNSFKTSTGNIYELTNLQIHLGFKYLAYNLSN